MKESMIYKCAQAAVLRDEGLGVQSKLEILRFLMKQEDVALFCERQAEESANEAV